MSSAIVKIGGTQVLRLGSPLIIGIYLPGTIAHIGMHEAGGGGFRLQARPHAPYLARTLQSLQCHVTLIVPPLGSTTNFSVSNRTNDHFAAFFERHFPGVRYSLLYDQPMGHRRAGQRSKLSARNYTDYFTTVAAQTPGGQVARVLFIDSEVNYRFSPVQTLVMETFEPLTYRQQRQRMRAAAAAEAEDMAGAGSGDGGLRITPLSESRAGRKEYEKSLRGQAEEIADVTAMLLREQRLAHRSGSGLDDGDSDDGSGWLGSRSYAPARNPNSPSAKRNESSVASGSGETSEARARREREQEEAVAAVQKLRKSGSVPVSTENVSVRYVPSKREASEGSSEGAREGCSPPSSSSSDGATGGESSSDVGSASDTAAGETEAASGGGGGGVENERGGADDTPPPDRDEAASSYYYYSKAAAAAALELQKEDFSLVAVAEFVAELAASDAAVATYLKMEPLIEKLRVPFHGTAFYLPVENCEYMEQIDWVAVRVEEQRAREAEEVPEVKETAEHEDFFK